MAPTLEVGGEIAPAKQQGQCPMLFVAELPWRETTSSIQHSVRPVSEKTQGLAAVSSEHAVNEDPIQGQ